jgi:hypothetical protein
LHGNVFDVRCGKVSWRHARPVVLPGDNACRLIGIDNVIGRSSKTKPRLEFLLFANDKERDATKQHQKDTRESIWSDR